MAALEIDFHKVSQIELCERFNTNTKTGLSHDDAAKGLEKHGHNLITPPPTTPYWVKFLQCLFSQWFPWMVSAVCFIAYKLGFSVANYYLGLVICGLTLVDRVYSFYQRISLESLMSAYKCSTSGDAQVLRNGEMMSEKASNLTLGDVVEITEGDVVPADLRILQSNGCKVNQSSLTGESEPKLRSPKLTDENPLETQNLAFMNTTVEEGSAIGMVVFIGDQTVSGRISGLATGLEMGQTSTNRKIENFIFTITAVTSCLCVILYIIAYFYGSNWLFVLIFLIGLIPTYIHAKINRKINDTFAWLSSRGCLLKDMEAMETLEKLTTICLNKTGVITQFNRMTVVHLWQNNKIEAINFNEAHEEYKKSSFWKPLQRAAMLCNNAVFKPGQNDIDALKREFCGNATDGAILKTTELIVGNTMEYRANNKKVYEVPFKSFYRYQITIHETEEKQHLIVMKGAPEKIIERCDTIFIDGKDEPLTQERKAAIQNDLNEMAGLGERVIGFCDLLLPADKYPIGHTFEPEEEDFDQGFRFVGFMSMIDPPRAATPDTVSKLRKAGVKVIMVTGDHPVTAKAIARSVGILEAKTVEDKAARMAVNVEDVDASDCRAIVIHGDKLRDMSHFELSEVLSKHTDIVFARTSAFQKLSIVQALHMAGEVVAVSGNGINDIPALKTADLGIAMSPPARDVVKNAADMIILDHPQLAANVGLIFTALDWARNVVFKTINKIPSFNMN